MSGDQLLALAGYKVIESSLPQLLRRLALGSIQDLVIFRKDRLLTLTCQYSQPSQRLRSTGNG
ncbi:hypothetical protein ALON55S_05628 [Alishewanella longhuensis]